jgi:3-phosphoshikimate 1-carboxyvinyltransferase
MKATIGKSNITGSAAVPSSKSMTIRALMCAAFSVGESEIINPLDSEDTQAATEVLEKVGTFIRKLKDSWKVTGGHFKINEAELNCKESATTFRFMTAIASLIPGQHKLAGGPSLTKRPVGSLVDALAKLGVSASYVERAGFPPVIVHGGTFKGGLTEIPGNVSSQYISALLLLAPFAQKSVNIKLTTPLTSRSYVLMTLWCLKQFGIEVERLGNEFVILRQRYRPATVTIESDWSSASYFLALGAISDEGVLVQNLNQGSLQGDRVILNILRIMGARVRISGANVVVKRDRLKGIRTDLSDCIDLLPTVAVLAALASGVSELSGIARARIKESNRVAAVREGLVKLGVTVIEDENRMTITGMDAYRVLADDGTDEATGEAPTANEFFDGVSKGATVINSHGDHRIAMAFSILGAAIGDITISRAECVAKTFPTFWDEFRRVGGEVKFDE